MRRCASAGRPAARAAGRKTSVRQLSQSSPLQVCPRGWTPPSRNGKTRPAAGAALAWLAHRRDGIYTQLAVDDRALEDRLEHGQGLEDRRVADTGGTHLGDPVLEHPRGDVPQRPAAEPRHDAQVELDGVDVAG